MSIEYKDLVEEFGFDLWPVGDRRGGRIGSAMPAWYFEGHYDEEKRNLDNQRIQVQYAPPERRYSMEAQLRQDEQRLEMIKQSFPKPSSAKTDYLATVIEELGEVIARSLFPWSEMQSGKASAHEELKRSKDPVIPLPRHLARWIIYCNGQVINGKVKRDDAVRAWKIGRKILHESTWVEDLRPMERPEDVRRGDYESIFTGFDNQKEESLTIKTNQPEFSEPTFDEPVEDERDPCECGASMIGEPKQAKWCQDCREERKASGRKNTDKDAVGSSE